MIRKKYTYTSSKFWDFQVGNGRVEMVALAHPIAAAEVKRRCPHVKAVVFDTNTAAFQGKDFDLYAYLETFLAESPDLEYISIASSILDRLPSNIIQLPLIGLELHNCVALTNLPEILPQLKHLETIHLGAIALELGEAFYQLPYLQSLVLHGTTLLDIHHLVNCTELRYLEIRRSGIVSLPNISQLKQLKTFICSDAPHLEALPELKGLECLEWLNLNNLPQVKSIPDQFQGLTALKRVNLIRLGTKEMPIELPTSINQVPTLEYLNISTIWTQQLPLLDEQLQGLKEIYLSDLPLIKTLPESIGNISHLERLSISRCPNLVSLPKTLGDLRHLKYCHLEDLPITTLEIERGAEASPLNLTLRDLAQLRNIDQKLLRECKQLIQLAIIDCPLLETFPTLSASNESLKVLHLKNCPKLTELPESIGDCEVLDYFRLDAVGLKTLPQRFTALHSLTKIEILNCKDLTYLPTAIAEFPHLEILDLRRSKHLLHEGVVQARDIFPIDAEKYKLDDAQQKAVLYWLLNNHRHETLSLDIRKASLTILGLPHEDLRLLILKHIWRMNPNQISFTDIELKQGATVHILGQTEGKKADLRKDLEDLGLTYKTRWSKGIDYVLVGKKPKIPANFWEKPRFLLTEVELAAVKKEKLPNLLQPVEIVNDFVSQLYPLLWSIKSEDELKALKLAKDNGLPELLHPAFIVVAKTSPDKKVRADYRKFLKGRLNDAEQKVLTDRNKMDLKKHESYVFLSNYVSNTFITSMIVTHYKRSGLFLDLFFRYDDGNSPFRADLFQDLLPTLLKKTKYLNLHHGLTEKEITYVLNLPQFKGVLERLVIRSPHLKSLPKSILQHSSLKILEIGNNFQATKLPDALFSLEKLHELRLYWYKLKEVPASVQALKRLKLLFIYAQNPVLLPNELTKLPKLKTIQMQNGIANIEAMKAALPTCAFLSPNGRL